METFGTRLARVINSQGISIYKLSSLVNINHTSITAYVADRQRPSVDALEKIARFFTDVSLDYLVLGEGPMFKSDEKPAVIGTTGNDCDTLASLNKQLYELNEHIRHQNEQIERLQLIIDKLITK